MGQGNGVTVIGAPKVLLISHQDLGTFILLLAEQEVLPWEKGEGKTIYGMTWDVLKGLSENIFLVGLTWSCPFPQLEGLSPCSPEKPLLKINVTFEAVAHR